MEKGGRKVPSSYVLIILLMGAPLSAADETSRSFRFAQLDEGHLPAGWKSEHTGIGHGSIWKVVVDGTAPSGTGYVLAQTAQSPNAFFNLCVAEDSGRKDLEAAVAFKAMQGKNDQGGGIVWRFQDADNYYIARMNPLENNYRVYKVVAGKRKQLDTKEGLKVKAGEWHRLRITMTGDHIQCFLDGDKLLDAHDASFTGAGKVGLWSKSDAQTYFDDFNVSGK
jgi:hypothetical protein